MSSAIAALESDHSSESDDEILTKKETTTAAVRRRIVIEDIDLDSSSDSLLLASPYHHYPDAVAERGDQDSVDQCDEEDSEVSFTEAFDNLKLTTREPMPVDERAVTTKNAEEAHGSNVNSRRIYEASPITISSNDGSLSSQCFTPTSASFDDSALAKDDSAWTFDSFNDSMYLSSHSSVKWPEISIKRDLFERLYPHQKVGVQWMASMHINGVGGILGDDMGMGKTFQTLTYLGGLMRAGSIRNALVVAPVSVLHSWEREARDIIKDHCMSSVTITVASSDVGKSRRGNMLDDALQSSTRNPHLVITTYGLVSSDPLAFVSHEPGSSQWDYVVLDEGHKIKNPSAKISKAARRICHKRTHRLLLTGTPIQNNLKELWALFDWATSGNLLGKLKTFELQFAKPIEDGRNKNATNWTFKLAEKCGNKLQKRLQPHFLQRTKNVTFRDELPTKRELVIWTHLSEKQRSLYQHYLQGQKVASVLAGEISSPLEAITWLKKLCGHPLLVEGNRGTSSAISLVNDSVKLRVLVALIERLRSSGHRTLIFSQSTRMLNIIERVLCHFNICTSRIDGNTKQRDRQRKVDEFNSKDTKIEAMLLSTRAAGLGLTLVGADRCVVYDPSWNPAEDSQAVDRCYRISQTKDVTVYRFIAAGTVEEKIYEKQVHKDGIRRAVVTSQGIATERFFDKKDLRKLFALAPAGVCAMLSKLNNDISVGGTGSSGKPTFLVSHDGVVGISSHDAVYTRSVINVDDESDSETPFSGTPARFQRIGRSQRALSSKTVLQFAEHPHETENAHSNRCDEPSSFPKAEPLKPRDSITNVRANIALERNEHLSPLETNVTVPNMDELYDSMDRCITALEKQNIRREEKLDILRRIAILGRELGWLDD